MAYFGRHETATWERSVENPILFAYLKVRHLAENL